MGLFAFLIIGAVSGWISAQIVFGNGFGLLTNILLGIVGAVVGGFILNIANVSKPGGLLGQILTSILGAVIVLVVINLLRG